MSNDQEGFSLVDGLSILFFVGLLCSAGWYINSARTSHPATPSTHLQASQSAKQTKEPSQVTITLTNKKTGEPIARTKVKIESSNGILCVEASCNTNGKSWEGVTDGKGTLVLHAEYVQLVTTVTPVGYNQINMKYDETKAMYQLQSEPIGK